MASRLRWLESLSPVLSPFKRLVSWFKSLQPRSPHKSFRWTRRRDYARSLEMPGYIGFTKEVSGILWKFKNVFGWLVLVYAVVSGLAVGLASQEMYTQLGQVIRETSGDIFEGSFGEIGKAGTLLMTGISGALNPNLSDGQQLIGGLLVVMTWLTTVWILRSLLAGQSPSVRDAFYNAGAPIVPTTFLALILLAQLIPASLATIALSAALPTNLVSHGVEAMVFWITILLLFILSLYWVTSTLFAMIVVTLPGMYPLSALKNANELVVGRRLRIVLRVVWLLFVILVIWAVFIIPIIIADAWLKGKLPAIEWMPIVPVSLLIASSFSVVWAATYIYMLYRKVIDDGAEPA